MYKFMFLTAIYSLIKKKPLVSINKSIKQMFDRIKYSPSFR